MEIPITFEAKEKPSPFMPEVDEKTQEKRPRVHSDPQRPGLPRSWKIPITVESHIGRKKDITARKEIWDLQKDTAFAPSTFGISTEYPEENHGEIGSTQARRKNSEKSEAYFVIPIHYGTSKSEKNNFGGGEEILKEGGKDDFTEKLNTSTSPSWRDAERRMFTPEKPQKRSEINFEVSPGKKMVTKGGSDENKVQTVEKKLENLSFTSISSESEMRQEASGSTEIEKGKQEKTTESIEDESLMIEPEITHVAYTENEIGEMKCEISKLEKIAGIMREAAFVWSRISDLPDEKDNQKELRGAEETLTKFILNLDEIEVNGSEQIKNERKKAVEAIENLLLSLEERMKSG